MNTDELNRAVAEEVFGLVPCQSSRHEPGDPPCMAFPDSPDQGGEVRGYTTDGNAMLQVLEWAKDRGVELEMWPFRDEWSVCVWGPDSVASPSHGFLRKSLPEAVARAALAVVRGEREASDE